MRCSSRDPLALLIGMLLDQQVPMEWAFRGPATLSARLGGLDAARISAMSPEAVEAVFKEKPALHRYPGSMGKRTHALCRHIVDNYGGDAEKIWRGVRDPNVLFERLRALPGYGDDKAKIMLAILGKRFGRAPGGLGTGGGTVLRRPTPLGRRRRFARGPRPGPGVEAGPEGQRRHQIGLIALGRGAGWPRRVRAVTSEVGRFGPLSGRCRLRTVNLRHLHPPVPARPGGVRMRNPLGRVGPSIALLLAVVGALVPALAAAPAAATDCGGANAIVCENALPGSPPEEWNVGGDGDPSIQGFATEMSVNVGDTVRFKVQTDASDYTVKIFRIGYYGGNGARLVDTVDPRATLPQTQPPCLTDATGLVDCGNWGESASWSVPAMPSRVSTRRC